jgi:hypothetical protein
MRERDFTVSVREARSAGLASGAEGRPLKCELSNLRRPSWRDVDGCTGFARTNGIR